MEEHFLMGLSAVSSLIGSQRHIPRMLRMSCLLMYGWVGLAHVWLQRIVAVIQQINFALFCLVSLLPTCAGSKKKFRTQIAKKQFIALNFRTQIAGGHSFLRVFSILIKNVKKRLPNCFLFYFVLGKTRSFPST